MQTTIALLALAAASAVSAQGIAAGTLKPSTASPAGCSQNYAGNFEITVVTPSKKRDLEKRQSACAASGVAVLSLANGILTDSAGRIGGIVANRQFQFDGPPSQTGTIYNGGWSVCSNGSIAIGGNAQFYQCGSGSFYNLYDTNIGAQCSPILIDIIPCTVSSGSAAVSSGVVAVSTKSDGQPIASKATTAAVSQITDGQVQAQSAKPISQYTDGQLQGTAMATVTKAPVSQISDGQIQATSKAPAATTMATTTAKPVSQISDGQIQAASTTLTRASATTSAVYTGAAAAVTPLAGLAAVAALAAML